jgi:uncharacterized damage-inducible protein DinB
MKNGAERMRTKCLFPAVFAVAVFLCAAAVARAEAAAAEYAKHFAALTELSIAVAEAMPAEQYSFKPHAESMDFGALVSHIAATNYQFCAGLKDTEPPSLSTASEKVAIVKFLRNSFDYCSGIIASLSSEQLERVHNSPDGRLPGREVLLAMYVHVAHHRGQAEIYLRDKGIRPPRYMI